MEEAVETASQFLGSGNVLLEKNAKGEVTPVSVRPGGLALSIPMVVLINGGPRALPKLSPVPLRTHTGPRS